MVYPVSTSLTKHLHGTSDTPYAWYRGSVSSNTSWATIAILHTEEAYGPQDNQLEMRVRPSITDGRYGLCSTTWSSSGDREPNTYSLMRYPFYGHKTRGTTVDDSFPGDITTKRTYRGPQGPVLDGVPLGQLGIEGINNNNALPLTVLAAVTFTSDLPPADTNRVGHRPRALSLDSAPMLLKAVAI